MGVPPSCRGRTDPGPGEALGTHTAKITPRFCLDLSLITPVYPAGVATCLWLLRHLPGLTDGSLCRGGDGAKPLSQLFRVSCQEGVNAWRDSCFQADCVGVG